jgi:Primase C terminal 1 (PriCT-1)./Replicase family.
LRYLAAVERGLCRAVGGDVGYAGLITKNPLHHDWHVIERHWRLWTLDELAADLDLSPANARKWTPEPGEAHGTGRNVSLFHETRHWAYKAIREYWAPNGLSRWSEAVTERVEALNGRFPAPLPYSEVKSVAKSISGWTWRRFTPQGLQDLIGRTHTPEIQAKRGRKGGLAATNQSEAGKLATNQSEAGRLGGLVAGNQLEIAGLGGKASGEARRAAREDLRATARLMAASGQSTRHIGAALGVDQSTVVRWLAD